ncbi:MAG: rod shape-determining protein MreC [Pseudomonadota bacterium]
MKPLFQRTSSKGFQAVLVAILALGLVVFEQRSDSVNPLRSILHTVTTPFYWLADIPKRASIWSAESLVSRRTLLEQNAGQRIELLILKGKLQKMAGMAAENVRLRELLNSSTVLDSSVLVAELISISADPRSHKIVLNKGTRDGVYLGQAVLDSEGLMGQIIDVGPNISRALLVSDSSHALPVQINRNGVRSVAAGTGLLHELELRHVAATTDIKVGDLLVSSGLGRRFPVGYPVADVTEVVLDPGQPFATVKAMPRAQLNRSRHVLLVFTESDQQSFEAKREPAVNDG